MKKLCYTGRLIWSLFLSYSNQQAKGESDESNTNESRKDILLGVCNKIDASGVYSERFYYL